LRAGLFFSKSTSGLFLVNSNWNRGFSLEQGRNRQKASQQALSHGGVGFYKQENFLI